MSFDGLYLSKIVNELQETLTSGRISKVYQLSKHDLLLQIRSRSKKQEIIISSSPEYSRVHLTNLPYTKPSHPPMFCMFLRKHIEGSIILDISQYKLDRIVIFKLSTRNELGDKSIKLLIVEVMGKHSNIILTDESYKILDVVKHVSPFDDITRTMQKGAMYLFPESSKLDYKDDKAVIDFFKDLDNVNAFKIQQHFLGFSTLLAEEIIYQFENSNSSIVDTFNQVVNSEVNPVLFNNKRHHFYFFNLSHITADTKEFDTVNSLTDYYYYNRDEAKRVKQKSKDLELFIKNNISKIKNKIVKLNKQLLDTDKRDIFRIKGELIKANLHLMKNGDAILNCINYYTNEAIEIILDPKLSPVKNSEKYFKKFKKFKTSIPYINKEITSAIYLLEYFELLLVQLNNASMNDIDEMRSELEDKKLLKKRKRVVKKNKKPNYESFIDADGIEILVGKNNIQNEYITHKIAKRLEVWFHVKNAPGSHVLVRKEFPLSETTIRTAALLAANYSKLKNSSSVGVDYVEVKYLKKVPGKINSFVTYSTNKTIYIDPDQEFILNLKKK
ncbi:MAG: NFACT RNA binding domain-containing protein [Candidatus Izemoplasma sp.]